MKAPYVVAVTALATVSLLAGCNKHQQANRDAAASAPQATSQMAKSGSQSQVTEEDLFHFNCLTMGNHKCGPTWLPIDVGWREQVVLDNPSQDPKGCLVLVGDTTYIDCPNGRIYTS